MSRRFASTRRPRRGLAFVLVLFIMVATSLVVVTTLDSLTLQRAALRNTLDYDRARYLAEAGVQHALSALEADFGSAGEAGFSLAVSDYPAGSGNSYQATVGPLTASGTRVVIGVGVAGGVTRQLQIEVKMGG